MRYSLGINISDFGFTFFEKLHEPVFLVHRLKGIVKMNEAARKLLKVAGRSTTEIEGFVQLLVSRISEKLADGLAASLPSGHLRLSLGHDRRAIATVLSGSDYILVEVH